MIIRQVLWLLIAATLALGSDASAQGWFPLTNSATSLLPNQVGGLQLWLKADAGVFSDAGVTPATNGATVQQWNDQSGNGNNATQATAGHRPTYQTGLSGLNGLPAITFNGALSSTTNSYLNNAYTGEPVTVFVVHAATVPVGGVNFPVYSLLDAASSNGANHAYSLYSLTGLGSASGTIYGAGGFNRSTTAANFTSALQPAVNVLDIMGVRHGGLTNFNATRQDIKAASGALSGTASTITLPTIGGFWSTTAGGTQYANGTFNGPIVEIAEYNRDLTDLEYSQVLTGLQNKWSIDNGTSGNYFVSMESGGSNGQSTHTSLYMFRTTDGINYKYKPTNLIPVASNHNLRDPGLLLAGSSPNTGGLNWLACASYSNTGFPFGDSIALYSSPDLKTWTFSQNIDVSAFTGTGATTAAAVNPNFFVENDGTVRMILAARNNLSQGSFIEVHPTTPSSMSGSWSTPVDMLGGTYTTFPANVNGPYVIKIGSTYYMSFGDGGQGADTTVSSWFASSTSATPFDGTAGRWTVIQSGDWAGWFAAVGKNEELSYVNIGGTWYMSLYSFATSPGGNFTYYATSSAIPGTPSSLTKVNHNLLNSMVPWDGSYAH